MNKIFQVMGVLLLIAACNPDTQVEETAPLDYAEAPFMWENATVYFLLTDRFYNADPTNDQAFNREPDGALLRNFMGGDIKGITRKIEEGYFDSLGVNAIWMTPVVEQVKGSVDEGTGKTYAYHGYWTRDWTALDPNFGTMDDLKELVETAHKHDIRVLLDVVLNHTGPVTPLDSQWPDSWVRTDPTCTYQNYETTVECTLVDNLPDIKTEREELVELPEYLLAKWEEEGRKEQELKELDEWFAQTEYPRTPRYYIMKWIVDYIKELGVDGFRVDTVKHTEAGVWDELYEQAMKAFEDWKKENPGTNPSDEDFYMVGEVYNYSIHGGKDFAYDGNDTTVNFFDNGFKSLINFSLKYDVQQKSLDEVYSTYAAILNEGELSGKSVLNYMSSHDDGNPYDRLREKPFETATYLMLSPGAAQIYYGDESARILQVEGAQGDANLRSFMNWEDIEGDSIKNGYAVNEVMSHWQKLGRFRKAHPSIGAGEHEQISAEPYVFKRTLSEGDYKDEVVVAVSADLESVPVGDVFEDGQKVVNYYTGEEATVEEGRVNFSTPSRLYLIAR